MPKKIPEEAKRISAEIKRWQKKAEEFKANLATAEGRVKALRAKRESLLLDAKANEDRRAQQELEKATTELQTAAREYGDARSIVQQINGKLTELEGQRVQAIRDAGINEVEALVNQRLELDAQIERETEQLAETLIHWQQLRAQMVAVASEHNLPGINVYGRTYVCDSYLTTRMHGAGFFDKHAVLVKEMRTKRLGDVEKDTLQIALRLARTGKVSEPEEASATPAKVA